MLVLFFSRVRIRYVNKRVLQLSMVTIHAAHYPLSYTAHPTSLGDGQSGSSSSGGTGESLNVCLLICATNTLYRILYYDYAYKLLILELLFKFILFPSGGYSRLQRKRDTIIGHLADLGFTGELAEKLLGADMITRRIYDQARNVAPGMVEMDRAAVLFNAVLASVKLNPAKYAQFISILQQIQGSSDLVGFIEGGLL